MYINRIETEMKGKSVIITGGNKGIGRGCAEAFCEYGANVVIAARDKKAGRDTADELTRKTDGQCVFIECDMSDEQAVREMVEKTNSLFGRIDCLINNAGYLPLRRPLDLCSITDMENVFKTNVAGMFLACKYALPYIRKIRGNIVNISSILAHAGQEGSCLYTATKGAIISFTKSLAIDEVRHGVRVNAVLPGNITSEIGTKETQNTEYRLPVPDNFQVQWIDRPGEPAEIGTACLFLASSWASYISGAEILIDGGFMLGNSGKIKMFDWSNIQQ
ncbi:MAG: SDR family oxidoreductase [Treponema sp.]|jgi:NAD(P)-dependent dehydrogenase (short-subunit alcohol dehydrogenase family)|nr:SDR family oxidoreductase [Treponema sp.]